MNVALGPRVVEAAIDRPIVGEAKGQIRPYGIALRTRAHEIAEAAAAAALRTHGKACDHIGRELAIETAGCDVGTVFGVEPVAAVGKVDTGKLTPCVPSCLKPGVATGRERYAIIPGLHGGYSIASRRERYPDSSGRRDCPPVDLISTIG